MYHRKTAFLLIVGFVAACLAEDYYDLLNIKRDASEKEIRQAFKKLAIKHHPDKNTVCPQAIFERASYI